MVFYLLRGKGLNADNFLMGGLLALLSACVCYDVATSDLSKLGNKRGNHVQEISN